MGPLYVEALLCLDKELSALERLTALKKPLVRYLRDRAWVVAYLIGYTSGKGFWYALLSEDIMGCESGEFSLVDQGISSVFR